MLNLSLIAGTFEHRLTWEQLNRLQGHILETAEGGGICCGNWRLVWQRIPEL